MGNQEKSFGERTSQCAYGRASGKRKAERGCVARMVLGKRKAARGYVARMGNRITEKGDEAGNVERKEVS